jgi:hypothetical protein
MSIEDPDELKRIDQEIRINELKAEAEELSGGQIHSIESDDCPPDISEQFWERVVAFEKAPWTSHFKQLTEAGVDLSKPESLSEADLTAKLWEVVRALAKMHVFLVHTNHLSDRELYSHLWSDSLREEVADVPAEMGGSWHIDILGSGSEEDMFLYHKFYASEESRQHWLKDFPDSPMPPHEDPPHDRDQRLPRGQFR